MEPPIESRVDVSCDMLLKQLPVHTALAECDAERESLVPRLSMGAASLQRLPATAGYMYM